MKPVVKILVSCPNPAWIDACTWVFPTLRTGFPTAKIDLEFNAHISSDAKLLNAVEDKLWSFKLYQDKGMSLYFLPEETHHADWIRTKVAWHPADGAPLVILDADTYFHSSVEDWRFDSLLSGYYVPPMWNDFAKCPSVSRIHTSFMWFENVHILRQALKEIYPMAHDNTGAYSPCDPFMPAVRFFEGRAVFWDTCANLFQMLHGRYPVTFFDDRHKAAYEHLNSAAFFDVMKTRLPDGENFERLHREWLKDPAFLKGRLWPTVDNYYLNKQKQLKSAYL